MNFLQCRLSVNNIPTTGSDLLRDYTHSRLAGCVITETLSAPRISSGVLVPINAAENHAGNCNVSPIPAREFTVKRVTSLNCCITSHLFKEIAVIRTSHSAVVDGHILPTIIKTEIVTLRSTSLNRHCIWTLIPIGPNINTVCLETNS